MVITLSAITFGLIYLFRAQVQEPFKLALFFYIILMTYCITKSIGSFWGTLFTKSPKLAIVCSMFMVIILNYFNNFMYRIDAQPYFIQAAAFLNYLYYFFNSMILLVYGMGRCSDDQSSRVLSAYNIENNESSFWNFMTYFLIKYLTLTMLELILFMLKSNLQIPANISFNFGLKKHRKAVKNQNDCIELNVQAINNNVKNCQDRNEIISQIFGEEGKRKIWLVK